MSDRVQREGGQCNVCVHVQMCVQTRTHGHVWVSLWMKSVISQPRPSFVHTDTQLCLKHFLNKRRWQLWFKGDYEAALHIATPNSLPSPSSPFLPGVNPAAVQQHKHNGKGHLHKLNHPKTETKRPKYKHKWMVYTRFLKGQCVRRWEGRDTDEYLRNPAPCCGKSWVEQGVLLCCIGPCRLVTE